MEAVFGCETCRLALTNPQWQYMADMKCRDCLLRHLDRCIEATAAAVGLKGIPAEQVKDELFEHLLKWRAGGKGQISVRSALPAAASMREPGADGRVSGEGAGQTREARSRPVEGCGKVSVDSWK